MIDVSHRWDVPSAALKRGFHLKELHPDCTFLSPTSCIMPRNVFWIGLFCPSPRSAGRGAGTEPVYQQ
jgi:hypothetical protein